MLMLPDCGHIFLTVQESFNVLEVLSNVKLFFTVNTVFVSTHQNFLQTFDGAHLVGETFKFYYSASSFQSSFCQSMGK